ncbi:hypothetical protein GCM10027403_12470 [Arthrobacter tecti]
MEADRACSAELGFDKIQAPEYTDAFLTEKYQETVEARDCLVSEGYSPPQLPSMQAFKDMLLNEGKIYSVHDETGLRSGTPEGDTIRETCADPLETWSS